MSATFDGSRAVTTPRQPRASTSFANSRPKPVEQPVINQTGLSRFIISDAPVPIAEATRWKCIAVFVFVARDSRRCRLPEARSNRGSGATHSPTRRGDDGPRALNQSSRNTISARSTRHEVIRCELLLVRSALRVIAALCTRSVFALGGIALGAGLTARRARAATWPSRPIRFIVPFPPAGSTDILAREIALEAAGRARSARRRREQAGRGRIDRLDRSSARGRGRVHAADGAHRHAGGQPFALSEAGLRSAHQLHAGRADGARSQRAGRQSASARRRTYAN